MGNLPSKTSSAKVVATYLATNVANGTIGGGALYTALFMLLAQARGALLAQDGQVVSVFAAGKLQGMAKISKAGVITSLVDGAGASLLVAPSLRVEQALAWAKTGKVPAKVLPLYLTSKAARAAVAAGKLPEGWA
jgi:hypothetical protein